MLGPLYILLFAATLEYAGKPLALPFQCTGDDLTRAGLTCPPGQPCPVYLELTGMDATGSHIVAAGNLHADAATLFSILLVSNDSGKTWHEPFDRIPGAALELVQLLDFENGWVSGAMTSGVTRDPFLLLTHDGGKTWRNRPVFDESRAAAIDSFRFDSPLHGILWIDRSQSGDPGARYERFESSSGGESWQLREAVSKLGRAGPRVAAPAGWRLRTDAPTRSYHIERKGANGWETIAGFLVRVGECREPEPSFAEPAPQSR